MLTSRELQEINWAIARSWHTGLGLIYKGVELGDVLAYDVLRVIGRQLAITKDESEAMSSDTDNEK